LKWLQFLEIYADEGTDHLMDDQTLVHALRGCRRLRRLYIPSMSGITGESMVAMSESCPRIESIEISFISETSQWLYSMARLDHLKSLRIFSPKHVALQEQALLQFLSTSKRLETLKIYESQKYSSDFGLDLLQFVIQKAIKDPFHEYHLNFRGLFEDEPLFNPEDLPENVFLGISLFGQNEYKSQKVRYHKV
jgi:hypothetical protein